MKRPVWRSEDEIDATPWMLLNEPTLRSVFPFYIYFLHYFKSLLQKSYNTLQKK